MNKIKGFFRIITLKLTIKNCTEKKKTCLQQSGNYISTKIDSQMNYFPCTIFYT